MDNDKGTNNESSIIHKQDNVKYKLEPIFKATLSENYFYTVGEPIVKTPCILECYYDKELQCCGSCFRTLDEIRLEGKKEKE